MKIYEQHPDLITINEMFINVEPHLPGEIEGSIYYPKLKTLLRSELISFCKEQIELKGDLEILRMNVGQVMSEREIREYLDSLMDKYNTVDNNVGIEYHIEATRVDFGVSVFVVIKRTEIHMKKFVFRFKKEKLSDGVSNLSQSGMILNTLKKGRE